MKKIAILLILMISSANAETNKVIERSRNADTSPIDKSETTRMQNRTHIDTIYKARLKASKGNPDILILPGLEANRITKEIHITAEATGIKADATAEYFLIGEQSGHDYEALAISFALPSSIRKALIFLGMTPGRPVNHTIMQFWPKGERITMRFRKTNSPSSKYTPIESLIKNSKTGKVIPTSGFVFTGSRSLTSRTNSTMLSLAADELDPRSIAANYNEIDSLFDLPRIVDQGEVYNSQVVNSAYSFKPGELLDIIVEPEYKDGKTRVRDFTMKVNWSPATSNGLGNMFLDLSDTKETILTNATLPELLEQFKEIINAGHDPFVSITFADDIPVQRVNKLCAILDVLDSENGIRIEAPTKGQLYYKSFVPREDLRKRQNRTPLKWEMHVNMVDQKVEYSLINIDAIWKAKATKATLIITEHKISNKDELLKILKSQETGIPVMIIFTEPEVPYKALIDIVEPIMHIYNAMHIFIGNELP